MSYKETPVGSGYYINKMTFDSTYPVYELRNVTYIAYFKKGKGKGNDYSSWMYVGLTYDHFNPTKKILS